MLRASRLIIWNTMLIITENLLKVNLIIMLFAMLLINLLELYVFHMPKENVEFKEQLEN